MSRSQKSNTLYSHPFSKAYWRDAAAELKDTHMLVFAALMIALRLVMKQLAIPITPFLKINTAFFVNALGAMVFGPVMAMASKFTVASVHEIVALGTLDPEAVVTPGIFVSKVVRVERQITKAGGIKA